jgi:hypothetical protein
LGGISGRFRDYFLSRKYDIERRGLKLFYQNKPRKSARFVSKKALFDSRGNIGEK